VLNPARRYWVHALWTFLALFGHLVIWWEFWGYRDVASWNFGEFALMLLNPGILFVCSSTLVRVESDADMSWDRHFFEIRRAFFGTFAMLPFGSVLRRWVLADLPVLSPENVPELFFAMLCAIGFATANRRAHGALVVTYWLGIVMSSAYPWFRPGAIVN
jgi:hypothetical protein